MRGGAIQRLRVTFEIRGPLKYASVLDLGRLWERLFRRAGLPLAYTQGFNPHPRLQFASALPVGYSSECELVDVFLTQRIAPLEFARATKPQFPVGLVVRQVEQVPLKGKAPQSTMREAHYRVRVWTGKERPDIEAAVGRLMARPQILRQRPRKGRTRQYDLRPLILEIGLESSSGGCQELRMVLRCGPGGAGRPEEVLAEMGLDRSDCAIHRYRLVWGAGEESEP